MRVNLSPKRAMVGGLLMGLAWVAAVYAFTARRLYDASRARRDDNCVAAEGFLAACWRLPVLGSAIDLEEQLLAVQQGDLRDEKALRTRAVGRSRESLLIREALAKGSLASFQWPEAESHAESILVWQAADARALWLRGRARVHMQQEEKARQDFEEALKIEPDAFEIRRSFADLLHKQGYVRDAIEHYQNLCHRRPNDPRVILALAHCWQEQSLTGEACALVDAFLYKRPDSVAGLVERSRLALRLGKPSDAERLLRRAVELNPDHADAIFILRLALQAQKKIDADLDRHVDQNDRRQAELKTLLHESAHTPSLMTDVGGWMMRTGHEDEAAGWFYSALKEDSAYAPAHMGLMEYFGKGGQTRRAGWHARMANADLRQIFQPHKASQMIEVEVERLPVLERTVPVLHVEEARSEDVHRLCAACHAFPSPDTMPRSAWRKEVKQGYEFLRTSTLAGEFPPLESTVLYYEKHAPERLPPIEQLVTTTPAPFSFEKRGTGWMPHLPPQPSVANANVARLFNSTKQELLLCDTRLDALIILKPYEGRPGGTVIPQVTAPSHTTVCDLDLDGRQDVLVASLGNFFPSDDKVGKVLWLQAGQGGQFVAKTILDGVGRVSDVQVADFNGDGRLDLIIAVFGWRTGGEILFLENRTTKWSDPQFASHVIDARHGAIHVPVAELNGDGRPDFIALISQEHESVVAFLNRGNGEFEPTTIFSASHPTYGCSGIEVVDLDGDRDLDVLLTNGDILDPPYLLKPYHGVQWLENEGVFPFRHHKLAAMYGASRAVAADFDGDGDLDIAAVSFLPLVHFPQRERMQMPSVAIFEQQINAQFAMHVLETGSCDHFSCDAGDWDDDGQVDLAVANFSWNGSKPMKDAAVLWRNNGKRATSR